MGGQAAPATQGGGPCCPLSPDVLTMSSAPGSPYSPTKPPITSPGPAWSPMAAEPFSTRPSKATPSCPPAPHRLGPLTFRSGSPNGPRWLPGSRLASCSPFLVSGVGCPVVCPMPPPPTSRVVKEEGGGPSHRGEGSGQATCPSSLGDLVCIWGSSPLQAVGRCLPPQPRMCNDVMTHCACPGRGRLAHLCHLVPASWSAPQSSGLHRTAGFGVSSHPRSATLRQNHPPASAGLAGPSRPGSHAPGLC